MKPDLVAVLDLGSTKTVCLAATPDERREVQVEAVAVVESRGVRRGVINDLEAAGQAVDAVVRRVQQSLGHPLESLIVGVSGPHVEGMNAQGFVPIYPRSRHITREDVLQVINHSRQLMLAPDREMIHSLPREFRVDNQRGIQRPIGMSGSKLEVHTYVVTGGTPMIQNVERAVQLAGKKVDQMVFQGLGSGLGVLSLDDLEMGTAVVDIGGGTSELAIFAGGSLAHAVCLPIGGQLVTSDLSKLLKTSPEEADRLKTTYGAALARLVGEKESVEVMQIGQTQARPMQRRVLCEIIESRMRELATMVKQQVEKSGMMGMLPGGLVLTGGGALLQGSDRLFEDVFKHLRVRVAEPRVAASADAQVPPAALAAAMGMARFALQSYDRELVPAAGGDGWKDRIRTFWSLLSGKA